MTDVLAVTVRGRLRQAAAFSRTLCDEGKVRHLVCLYSVCLYSCHELNACCVGVFLENFNCLFKRLLVLPTVLGAQKVDFALIDKSRTCDFYDRYPACLIAIFILFSFLLRT